MNTTECLGGAQVLFWQQTVTAWVLWGLLLQGLWLLTDIWLWPFFLAFLKHDGIFFWQCLQLFSQAMQEKASSFASSEISLNWFPSSGFALMEGLSFSLVIWRLLKSLGIGLQDQALPLLNPKWTFATPLMLTHGSSHTYQSYLPAAPTKAAAYFHKAG